MTKHELCTIIATLGETGSRRRLMAICYILGYEGFAPLDAGMYSEPINILLNELVFDGVLECFRRGGDYNHRLSVTGEALLQRLGRADINQVTITELCAQSGEWLEQVALLRRGWELRYA